MSKNIIARRSKAIKKLLPKPQLDLDPKAIQNAKSHKAKPYKPTTTEASKTSLKQYKEAIADYDKAIELNPKDAKAYNNRGVAKRQLKQYKEAITDYDKAIKLNPKDVKAYNNRGLRKRKNLFSSTRSYWRLDKEIKET